MENTHPDLDLLDPIRIAKYTTTEPADLTFAGKYTKVC